MADYYRPLVTREPRGFRLAGGKCHFERVERISRENRSEIMEAANVPDAVLARLTALRAPICGISMQQPSIMGILNVTPDSFSDGGKHNTAPVEAAQRMLAEGADIVDIGGESTRPGADYIEVETELSRVLPVVKALTQQGLGPISVDSRKAEVAKAALAAGATLFNDVSALTFEADSLQVAAHSDAAVCLMHSIGTPETMQNNPSYNNALLEVYDYLESRISACEAAGIARSRIMVDPGLGFGKTEKHNLALIKGISLFHGLGCAILLGASRKSFIGRLGNAPLPERRFAGSIALALEGLNQGVQMLRVHDIAETKQAIALWSALHSEV